MNGIDNTSLFFIIGRERSGTTLLQSFLAAHPEVSIPTEAPFIPYLYRKYHADAKWKQGLPPDFIPDLLTHPYFVYWRIKPDALKEELNKLEELNFAIACKSVLLHQNKQARHVGDKNPQYTLYLKELIKLYPEAKFVWITRDPRAQVYSMLKVSFERKIVSALAYRWQQYNKKAAAFSHAHPAKMLWIKYEDLVAEPVETLQRTCTFLGVDYQEYMLTQRTSTLEDQPFFKTPQHLSLNKALSLSPLKAWKEHLNRSQIELIEAICQPVMETLGYAPGHRQSSFNRLSHKAAHFPGILYGHFYFGFIKGLQALPFSLKLFLLKKLIYPRFTFWINAAHDAKNKKAHKEGS